MRRYTFASIPVLVGLLAFGQMLRADAVRYTVENLGDAGGLVPTVTGINASGQVSGYVNGPSGPRAVRYTDGRGWEYLRGLETAYSQANGINAAGDIVGYRMNASNQLRAFRYRDGSGVEEIEPLTGGTMTLAYGINTAGDVVGFSDSPNGMVAFVARPGWPASPLPSLGGTFSVACGVNDAGQIAGSAVNTLGVQHAVRYDADQRPLDLLSFNEPIGFSAGCAIDANGRVGGQADGPDGQHAFRYDGTLHQLDAGFGTTSSTIESIAGGTSVGWYVAIDGTSRAFVNTVADGSTDLNTLLDGGNGWVLATAKGINADGSIVGEGTYNGVAAVYRLTKIASSDTTPPTITSLSASPNTITPPNDAMVPVVFSATATDDVDPSPVCAISGVDTNGAPSTSVNITGGLTASVRATARALYTFTVRCADASGNASSSSLNVAVPPDTTPPVFTSLTATPSVVWPPKGQTVSVTIAVTATDDSGQAPVCKLGYIAGPGSAPADFNVTGAYTGTVRAVSGAVYAFHAVCVDGSNNAAWSAVDVTVPRDTTAPVITNLQATPSTVWPPNGALVPVSVSVTATDDVDDAPVCALSGISSSTTTLDDSAITGPLSARVRAVGGRTYTLSVRCSDTAGNSSNAAAAVVVPRDTTAPVIVSISSNPGNVWPPNGRFVPVAVTVSASDDVDASPVCALTSITGASVSEFLITGTFTAEVRAEKNADGSTRVYSLNVTCRDAAGNASQASSLVTVSKDASPSKGANKPKK